MKINNLPIDPGLSGWQASLGDQCRYPNLEESIVCDWLIIGAGYAGLAIAKRLQEKRGKEKIVVVDACEIATGPAGRNSGFMIDIPHNLASKDYGGNLETDRQHMRLNRAGIDFAFKLAAHYTMPKNAIQASGKVNAAASDRGMQHNKEFKKYLDLLGEAYTVLDHKQMKELTGITYYNEGLFTPGTALIQPALFIQELAKGLWSEGVQMYENSPIINLEYQHNCWVARSHKGCITAPKVMLTVNGHIESFGFYTHHLLHVLTYASMTRKLHADEVKRLSGQSNWALTPADPLGTTVRRISDASGDRLIVRNLTTYNPSLKAHKNWFAKASHKHNKSFLARFPMLKDVSMEYCWGGRLCLSRNQQPVFGEIEENLYAACCQNGLGTAKGMGYGKLLAELAMENSNVLVEETVSLEKPTKLLPQLFNTIGVNAYIKWGEFKAGKEL